MRSDGRRGRGRLLHGRFRARHPARGGDFSVTALREPTGTGDYALWPAGSRIGILVPGEADAGFALAAGAGTPQASFSGTAAADTSNLTAYFPFPGPGAEGGIGAVFPAVQSCGPEGADPAVLPMTAVGSASRLEFRNLYGILRLRVEGAEGASRIILRSTTGQPVAGTALVSAPQSSSADPAAEFIDGQTTDRLEIEIVPPADAAGGLDAVLLPGEYAGLELTAVCDGGTKTAAIDETVTVVRSQVAELSVKIPEEAEESEDLNDPQRYGLPDEGPVYANCYPVHGAGRYSFAAVKPDGSPTEAVSADWLWSERGDAESGLLSEVSLQRGRIAFTASDQRGNALIAAYDGSGNIVWSWHIWLTEPAEDLVFGDGNTYMSLDLGAPTSVPGENPSPGLKYQWGRKDPFPAGSQSETTAFAEAFTTTVANGGHRWESVPIPSACDVAYACSKPMTFFYDPDGSSDYNWNREQDDGLWGDPKTVYDPCPPGYKIPPYGAWSDMEESNFVWDDTLRGRLYSFGSTQSWFAAGGVRWGDIDDPGLLGDVRNDGYYWLSTPHSKNASCLTFNTGWIIPDDYFGRICGMSIRCMKEL